jgi:hypothetical protein
MRYVLALLVVFAMGVMTVVPTPVRAQLEGPSVCQYRDGTVLNFRGLPCPAQPFWTRE